MDEAAARVRLDGRTVGLLLATVLALTTIDVATGRSLLGTTVPTFVADAGVALAVLLARRHLLAAAVLGAGASATVSAAVTNGALQAWAVRQGVIDRNWIVGLGAWPGVGELAGMAVLCALVLRHRPAAESVVAASAFGGALLAIVSWRQRGLHEDLFLLVVGIAFTTTVAVGLFARSLERRRADETRATRQGERDAIARELHDLVAHHVTGIVVQAQAARLVALHRPDVAERALSSIEQAGADALGSLRAMVGALRADEQRAAMAPAATIDDIRQLATYGSAALPVQVSFDGDADRLPDSVVASLHRIAIEAVTNACRHAAGATAVDVAVACWPQHVTLSVVNDGAVVGDRQAGFGLVGIAERAAALGGRFDAGPRPTGGWAVTAVLPTSRVPEGAR